MGNEDAENQLPRRRVKYTIAELYDLSESPLVARPEGMMLVPEEDLKFTAPPQTRRQNRPGHWDGGFEPRFAGGQLSASGFPNTRRQRVRRPRESHPRGADHVEPEEEDTVSWLDPESDDPAATGMSGFESGVAEFEKWKQQMRAEALQRAGFDPVDAQASSQSKEAPAAQPKAKPGVEHQEPLQLWESAVHIPQEQAGSSRFSTFFNPGEATQAVPQSQGNQTLRAQLPTQSQSQQALPQQSLPPQHQQQQQHYAQAPYPGAPPGMQHSAPAGGSSRMFPGLQSHPRVQGMQVPPGMSPASGMQGLQGDQSNAAALRGSPSLQSSGVAGPPGMTPGIRSPPGMQPQNAAAPLRQPPGMVPMPYGPPGLMPPGLSPQHTPASGHGKPPLGGSGHSAQGQGATTPNLPPGLAPQPHGLAPAPASRKEDDAFFKGLMSRK